MAGSFAFLRQRSISPPHPASTLSLPATASTPDPCSARLASTKTRSPSFAHKESSLSDLARCPRIAGVAGVHHSSVEDRRLDLEVLDVFDRDVEEVHRQDDDVGQHTGGEGAFALVLERSVSRPRRPDVEHIL